jgi:hypothetical protein
VAAHLEDAEVLLGQLAEVDTLLGLEVEGQLAPIPLVLGVDDLHRQAALHDLFAADHHRVILVLELLDHAADVSGVVRFGLTPAHRARRSTW